MKHYKPEGSSKGRISYRVNISICPKWKNIIDMLANQRNETHEDFIGKILNNKELKLNQSKGLMHKCFGFTIFKDNVSGIEQIWSDYDKCFRDDVVVRGPVLDGDGCVFWPIEYRSNNISNPIVITPEFIGFDTVLPDGAVLDEEKISKIPFKDILEFFICLGKEYDCEKMAVKKFPNELQQRLDKNDVKYVLDSIEDYGCGGELDPEVIILEWATGEQVELYNQRMRVHHFSNKYSDLNLDIRLWEAHKL